MTVTSLIIVLSLMTMLAALASAIVGKGKADHFGRGRNRRAALAPTG